jgi:endoglucanase
MNTKRMPFRRGILAATAILAGGLLAIIPSTVANATTVSFEQATWYDGRIHGVKFHVTNDTSQPLTDWRIDFDLPADTRPAWWEPIFYRLTVTPTATGFHVTIDTEPASQSWTILPGNTFTVGVMMNGRSAPTNCLVDGTTPCTAVTS